MDELTRAAFPAFFEAVTGHEPFIWQIDLTDRLLTGRIPDVIDVPTGLGKTSTLHSWAFALATTAAEPAVPRRLCFVVDRRLVVDAAWEEGEQLRKKLESALQEQEEGPVASVAAALSDMHADHVVPALEVVRMRGGVTWESRWLTRPDGPAVVVGTVDQFGSRLLFRGYGASDRMRPIDAALVGVDSWLVIDEAHISEPLVRTASSVMRYQTTMQEALPLPCLHVTRMSATADSVGEVLQADPDREAASKAFPRAAQAAQRRLSASKLAVLIDVENLTSVSLRRWRNGCLQLGATLAELGRQIDAEARVVGIIANTIATARAAHEQLTQAGERAILLTGRCRAFEREQLLAQWLPRIQVGAKRDPGARLFVVATQTVEVGANLDLDALITECAPLSSLIQRFGRVNRLGERETFRSAIVHAGFAHGEDDPVYGASSAATWAYLVQDRDFWTTTSKKAVLPVESSDRIQVELGLRAARQLADEARRLDRPVQPAPPVVPVLLGAHLERLVATHPRPFPDQPVGSFLHGVARSVPEVEVAWRARPPSGADKVSAWQSWLDLVRPVGAEFVRVPIWELQSLLRRVPTDQPTADVEGLETVEQPADEAGSGDQVFGVVYEGPNERRRLVRGPDDVRVGDRVVLDSAIGGHDRWGWVGARDDGPVVVPDIGDLGGTSREPGATNGRGVLRLHPATLSTFLSEDERGRLEDAFTPLSSLIADDTAGDEEIDADAVSSLLDALMTFEFPDQLSSLLLAARGWQVLPTRTEDGQTVVLLRRSRDRQVALDVITDEDVLSTSSGPRRQTLREHGEEVAALAGDFARGLGLPQELVEAVELAGLWHDAGKADLRFQVSLHDGDRLAAMAAAEPVAKSGRDFRDPIARRSHALAGVPSGFRHEAVSARLIMALIGDHPETVERLDTALIHHLVASHHGQARPLLRPLTDPDAEPVAVKLGGRRVKVEGADQVDWEHPARFEALNRRYGWWGLALLEALVRLADIRCSEEVRP